MPVRHDGYTEPEPMQVRHVRKSFAEFLAVMVATAGSEAVIEIYQLQHMAS